MSRMFSLMCASLAIGFLLMFMLPAHDASAETASHGDTAVLEVPLPDELVAFHQHLLITPDLKNENDNNGDICDGVGNSTVAVCAAQASTGTNDRAIAAAVLSDDVPATARSWIWSAAESVLSEADDTAAEQEVSRVCGGLRAKPPLMR